MRSSSKNRDDNILRSAASSGSRETFEAVLTTLERELAQNEVIPKSICHWGVAPVKGLNRAPVWCGVVWCACDKPYRCLVWILLRSHLL